MASLSLEQFRDVKERGFPGWETAMRAGPNEEPYVCPADARYGEPWFPFGADPALAGQAFKRWCADSLTGDHFVIAGPWTGLVYCQLMEDVAAIRHRLESALRADSQAQEPAAEGTQREGQG